MHTIAAAADRILDGNVYYSILLLAIPPISYRTQTPDLKH